MMEIAIGGAALGGSLLWIAWYFKEMGWRCLLKPKIVMDIILCSIISVIALYKGFAMATMLAIASIIFSVVVKYVF